MEIENISDNVLKITALVTKNMIDGNRAEKNNFSFH